MRIPTFITARALFARLLRKGAPGRIQPLDRRDQQLLERHRRARLLRQQQIAGEERA